MDGTDRPVAFVLPRGNDLYWGASTRRRHQMEFWLSPPGDQQLPELWSITPTAEPAPAPLPQFTQSMSPNLILAIRHGIHEPGGFSDWEPDGEFWFTAHNPRTACIPLGALSWLALRATAPAAPAIHRAGVPGAGTRPAWEGEPK
jgi:hypothetical protein